MSPLFRRIEFSLNSDCSNDLYSCCELFLSWIINTIKYIPFFFKKKINVPYSKLQININSPNVVKKKKKNLIWYIINISPNVLGKLYMSLFFLK